MILKNNSAKNNYFLSVIISISVIITDPTNGMMILLSSTQIFDFDSSSDVHMVLKEVYNAILGL